METRPSSTLQIMQRFNQAFVQHDASLLDDLIAEDCVMESVEPAPDGTRYVGYVKSGDASVATAVRGATRSSASTEKNP